MKLKLKLTMALLGLAALPSMPGITSATAAPAASQSSAKIWAEVARWPDLTTGMWMKERTYAEGRREVDTDLPAGALPQGVVLTPQAQALRNARRHELEFDSAKCLPLGPVRMRDFPTAFFYAGTSIFLMTDMDAALQRRVIMNAKEPSSDAYPTWSGTSTGRWEGGVLVIDTTLIRAGIALVDGLPSSGAAHIVERIRLLRPDRLEWKVTIEDPGLLQTPWTFTDTYKRQPDYQLVPTSCEEGNRDRPGADGLPAVDLTPPK